MLRDIYTIGHSTRDFEDFAGLLVKHGIEKLVDVRTIPRSRRHPQFNREGFSERLAATGVKTEYLYLGEELGGLRHPKNDGKNDGWKNASFRGYADHMATAEFKRGIASLEKIGRTARTAFMCAEAVPWRCHRSLIADALLVRGWRVFDITSASPPRPHALTSFARVRGKIITYPAPGKLPFE